MSTIKPDPEGKANAEEETGWPESDNTRGGHGVGWETRCIDCVPFQTLDARVERIEERSRNTESRLGTIETKLDNIVLEFGRLGDDVRKVFRFVDGNGDPRKGWTYRGLHLEEEVATLQAKFSGAASRTEKFAWALGIAFALSVLGTVWKLVLDGIQRGAIS